MYILNILVARDVYKVKDIFKIKTAIIKLQIDEFSLISNRGYIDVQSCRCRWFIGWNIEDQLLTSDVL